MPLCFSLQPSTTFQNFSELIGVSDSRTIETNNSFFTGILPDDGSIFYYRLIKNSAELFTARVDKLKLSEVVSNLSLNAFNLQPAQARVKIIQAQNEFEKFEKFQNKNKKVAVDTLNKLKADFESHLHLKFVLKDGTYVTKIEIVSLVLEEISNLK